MNVDVNKIQADAVEENVVEPKENLIPKNVDPKIVGSLSDSIELMATLGDPSRVKEIERNGKKIQSMEIVGYEFKAYKDITVPDVDAGPFLHRKDLMAYTEETKNNTRKIKKGETFCMTLFETAKLLTSLEFNNTVGKKNVFTLAFMKDVRKGVNVIREDGTKVLPKASLKATKGLSIKALPQREVFDVVRKQVEGKKKPVIVRTPKKEYAKWQALAKRKATTASLTKEAGIKKNLVKAQNLFANI